MCVLIEAAEIWVVNATEAGLRRSSTGSRLRQRKSLRRNDHARWPLLRGRTHEDQIACRYSTSPSQKRGSSEVSLRDPTHDYDKAMPVKLPHLASWAVAGKWIFVPLVGEDRLAVLDRTNWEAQAIDPSTRSSGLCSSLTDTNERSGSASQVRRRRCLRSGDRRREPRGRRHPASRPTHLPHGLHPARHRTCSISANADNKLFLVNASTREIEDAVDVASPSGIFGVWRAFRIGL